MVISIKEVITLNQPQLRLQKNMDKCYQALKITTQYSFDTSSLRNLLQTIQSNQKGLLRYKIKR